MINYTHTVGIGYRVYMISTAMRTYIVVTNKQYGNHATRKASSTVALVRRPRYWRLMKRPWSMMLVVCRRRQSLPFLS